MESGASTSSSGDEAVNADGIGPSGPAGASAWRRGRKNRRLKVGEEGAQDAVKVDEHEDAQMSPEILAFLDRPDSEIPPELQQQVESARLAIKPRRQLRPYQDAVPYGGEGGAHKKRTRNTHIGRKSLKQRVFCLETSYTMCAKEVVLALEGYGVLPPRPACRVCGRQYDKANLRVRSSESAQE